MSAYSKKLHIKKGSSQQDIILYTTTGEVGSNRLCLKDGSTTVYAKLVSTSDSNASWLHVKKGNTTYCVAKKVGGSTPTPTPTVWNIDAQRTNSTTSPYTTCTATDGAYSCKTGNDHLSEYGFAYHLVSSTSTTAVFNLTFYVKFSSGCVGKTFNGSSTTSVTLSTNNGKKTSPTSTASGKISIAKADTWYQIGEYKNWSVTATSLTASPTMTFTLKGTIQ